MSEPSDGLITKASAYNVDETIRMLLHLLDQRGVTVFSIVDHSGEAQSVGLEMPNTKLLIFGDPSVGTPVMLASPLIALDLPLKLLVWDDSHGVTWISYNAPSYLSRRHHLQPEQGRPLTLIEGVSDAVARAGASIRPLGECHDGSQHST